MNMSNTSGGGVIGKKRKPRKAAREDEYLAKKLILDGSRNVNRNEIQEEEFQKFKEDIF
jgi:hypothetical protein